MVFFKTLHEDEFMDILLQRKRKHAQLCTELAWKCVSSAHSWQQAFLWTLEPACGDLDQGVECFWEKCLLWGTVERKPARVGLLPCSSLEMSPRLTCCAIGTWLSMVGGSYWSKLVMKAWKEHPVLPSSFAYPTLWGGHTAVMPPQSQGKRGNDRGLNFCIHESKQNFLSLLHAYLGYLVMVMKSNYQECSLITLSGRKLTSFGKIEFFIYYKTQIIKERLVPLMS